MSDAERQARRRANLVGPRPALEALVALAAADLELSLLRRGWPPDLAAIERADLARSKATCDIASALGVHRMWPVRELERRTLPGRTRAGQPGR